ncbi:hypothetical protein BUALT_Bualt18G0045800 [Buddleja alternifolia]|uniref:Uncharacterized protein n=1 Tax=Buddleja alternifolia TaxID=168488 RepID=A0AAV6WBY3_9LAMI|nr:hypothetical protein BUALT_Bualt18G0045800 [Buddleja alternifolia]
MLRYRLQLRLSVANVSLDTALCLASPEEDEPLRTFFERFCNELIDVTYVGFEMIVSILIIGLKLGPFASALSLEATKSMEELSLMAQQYIREEEMNFMKGQATYPRNKGLSSEGQELKVKGQATYPRSEGLSSEGKELKVKGLKVKSLIQGVKDRFAVQLEFILTCLQRGSTGDAHQAALCLMQERGFDSDAVSNLVVAWYFVSCELPVDGIHRPIDYSKENDAFEAGEGSSRLQSDSNPSIANDKDLLEDDGKEPMDVDDSVKRETSHPSSQPQEFYMKSAEEDELSDHSFPDYSGDLPHASIFYTQVHHKSMGPTPQKGKNRRSKFWETFDRNLYVRLRCRVVFYSHGGEVVSFFVGPLVVSYLSDFVTSFHGNLEDAISMHRKLHDNYYKNALKHLRVALYSTPPILEAFHPLIQMLLLGDQVHEALDELENLFHSSDTVRQLRLKASLLENFDGGNYVKLCTCVEDILKKDPTCSVSLAKLVLMHNRGDYDTQNLVEMIALHLDATYGVCDTWKELASCILKLSQCEEDRVSTCYEGSGRYSQECLDNSNKIPDFFTKGESGKSWRFHSRWWLNRHFHNRILMSAIASGDLKLLTYKAATASHLYGRHFKYVVKATECIEKENDMELYSFLQTHILNSIGFYVKIDNTS